MSEIRMNRPITSYAKVQAIIGSVIRGRELFIDKKQFQNKVLLNVGCGPFPRPGFINLDYNWNPGIAICWDIVKKKYPLPSDFLEGIFTEHCLEHIPFESCLENLKEYHRMLKPGGTLRIVVPNGEIYCDLYEKKKADPGVQMPYGDTEETGMISLNRIMRLHGHQFIYDYQTFEMQLHRAGFSTVKQEAFGTGRDPRLLIDRQERAIESLYVEAVK